MPINETMPSANAKPKILVVEDEAIIAMDIAMQLQELGFQPVGHAASGEQAIEQAAKLRPDLILMDVQLLGAMDGISAAAAIRSQFLIPIVFLSAFDQGRNLERAKLVEPAGYLAKPFIEDDLRAVVISALSNK